MINYQRPAVNFSWRSVHQLTREILCHHLKINVFHVYHYSGSSQILSLWWDLLCTLDNQAVEALIHCPSCTGDVCLCEIYHFYRWDPSNFKNSIQFVRKFMNFFCKNKSHVCVCPCMCVYMYSRECSFWAPISRDYWAPISHWCSRPRHWMIPPHQLPLVLVILSSASSSSSSSSSSFRG